MIILTGHIIAGYPKVLKEAHLEKARLIKANLFGGDPSEAYLLDAKIEPS